MCISDVVSELTKRGVHAQQYQIRWKILTGRIPRPPKDGSGHFVFADEHVAALEEVLRQASRGGPLVA